MADTSKQDAPPFAEAVSAELADQINLQAKEYGTYVAAVQIFAGTALAYNPGDAIPIDNCERLGYMENGLAVKVGTKEHKALLESLGRA